MKGAYITTVRDQDSGAMLDVARGKGAASLKRFERKIASFKENIKTYADAATLESDVSAICSRAISRN